MLQIRRLLTIQVAFLIVGCASLGRSPANLDSSRFHSVLSTSLGDCYAPDFGTPARNNLRVNGHLLNPNQARNVQWISRCVAPYLPGSAQQRAEMAAKMSWWALREGILEMSPTDAFRYSNCNTVNGDRHQSGQPLATCRKNAAWQVGIAAGQVPNYSLAEIRKAIREVFAPINPAITEEDILAWTANLAGFAPGSSDYNSIVKADGDVKKSWLLRNPLVGAVVVSRMEVTQECLNRVSTWCTQGNYPAAVRFSRSSAAIKQSISDLTRIYVSEQSRPGGEPPPPSNGST